MIDTWTTHHKGLIGNRPYEAKTYSEGGYRVTTLTASDFDGGSYSDDSSSVIMPPVAAGTKVDIDSETIEELRRELLIGEFDDAAVAEIISHFPQV